MEQDRFKSVNLNVECLVKPNEKGLEAFKKNCKDKYGKFIKFNDVYATHDIGEGWLKMTLWEIMEYFGPACQIGSCLFENNEIKIINT